MRTLLATTLAILAVVGAQLAAKPPSTPHPDGVRALDGEWLYCDDFTEGRTANDKQAPMGPRLKLRVEDGAVVIVRSDSETRVSLDGSPNDVARGQGRTTRYTGGWKDGAFTYTSADVPATEGARPMTVEMRPTTEGMVLRLQLGDSSQVALFRHPQDIPLPTPATAAIADIAWLTGAWVGTRNAAQIEERWTAPRGGAMLAVSRTINKNGKMTAFEYLRIVERDGGLVYVAQPGGRKAVEYVLTELSPTRAVFMNPRHDHPQRISYELSTDGTLTALIGWATGGNYPPFEFKREGNAN